MILQLLVIWALEEHMNWSHEIIIGRICMTTVVHQ